MPGTLARDQCVHQVMDGLVGCLNGWMTGQEQVDAASDQPTLALASAL